MYINVVRSTQAECTQAEYKDEQHWLFVE